MVHAEFRGEKLEKRTNRENDRDVKFKFMFTFFSSRHRSELTAENLKHLEKVFRENLAKDKEEFTLAEFKKIVPSKNVSASTFPFWNILKRRENTMMGISSLNFRESRFPE